MSEPTHTPTCPPLTLGTVVAMRHAIACNIRAGITPLPAGASLTVIRQSWNESNCRSYIETYADGAEVVAASGIAQPLPEEPATDEPAPALHWPATPAAAPAQWADPFAVAPAQPAARPAPALAALAAGMPTVQGEPAPGSVEAAIRALVATIAPAAPAAVPVDTAALTALREELEGVIETEAERTNDKISGAVQVWVERMEALEARTAERIAQAAAGAPRAVVLTTPDGTARGATVANPHPLLETLCSLVLAGKPVMLAGPAGAGKTHLAAQAAAALGLEFGLHGAAMMAHELTGFVDANGRFVDTVASRQFRDGGLTCFDEHDGGSESAPLVLNAMLANRVMAQGATMVQAHADWRCIATCNTLDGATGTYTGRVKLDGATLNRYFLLRVDYTASIEEFLAGGNGAWLELCRRARREIESRGIPTVAGTYRDIETGAALIAGGMSVRDAARGLLCRGALTAEILRV